MRKLCFILFFSFFLFSCSTQKPEYGSPGLIENSGKDMPAGGPLVCARREAISTRNIKGEINPEIIAKCFELSSKNTIAEFELFIKPFSEKEKQIFRKVKGINAPITYRLNFDRLRGIMKLNALVSPREAARRGLEIRKSVTPGAEDKLLGAYDCVFATVGPPAGTKRYGNVLIKLKDSVKKTGWATPWSGHYFLEEIRERVKGNQPGEITKLMNEGKDVPVTFDDRLHYSHYIVTGDVWNEVLAFQCIAILRDTEEKKRSELTEKLLAESAPVKFWQILSSNHLAYLEAKFPGAVSSEYFESIEVPPELLKEVLSWPEAAPFKNIIKAEQ